MGLQMGRSAWIIWQLRTQDTLVTHASGREGTQVPRLERVQGSTGGMKEDFHEHLEPYKLCMVRSVVTKSIDKHPWDPSGHACHLPGLVRPLSPLSDGDGGLEGIPASH